MTDRKTKISSFEHKVMTCLGVSSYLQISDKESGESGFIVKGRLNLSSRTFDNHPEYLVLPSSRLIGKKRHLEGFLRDLDASEEYKSVVRREISDPLSVDNYKSPTAMVQLLYHKFFRLKNFFHRV